LDPEEIWPGPTDNDDPLACVGSDSAMTPRRRRDSVGTGLAGAAS
jgi:hypothetical protein